MGCSDEDYEDRYLRLKHQMEVLLKVNNLTGFLPMNLDPILTTIRKEMDDIFFPYKSELRLNDGCDQEACCGMLMNHAVCKALEDQLPLMVEPGESLCCAAEFCVKGFQSHICVPLTAGVEKLGVVTLKSKQVVDFSRDSMELLLAIVNRIAATIQRAKLFLRLEQEKDNLEKANTAINGLNQELQKSIDQLKRTREQLIISERLAAAGELSANLAHEINNPTGVILSRLELLLLDAEDQGLPSQVVEDLEVIKKHTERIARTTRGLLSFSRQVPEGIEEVDLNALVVEATDWLKSQFLRKKINFVLQLKPIPPATGNSGQIEQVLVNLFNNAKDAMPEGGDIRIQSQYDPESKMVQLDVVDTGTGIQKEVKNHIFDPFFTTKDKNRGTGLGLSISYKIIENLGGRIGVESELGGGSCFSIFLPARTTSTKPMVERR